MGNSDDIWDKWRRNASRQHNDLTDRYTALWEALVEAYQDAETGAVEYGIYTGLRYAYVLLTGDGKDDVERMVAQAARETVGSLAGT